MMSSLKRPAHSDHCSRFDQVGHKASNKRCGQPGYTFCPLRILVDAVTLTGEIAQKCAVAAATFIQKFDVMISAQYKLAGKRQHQRNICVGPNWPPFSINPTGQVIAY